MDDALVTDLFRKHLLRRRYASAAAWCRENVYLPAESGSIQGWFDPTAYQSAMFDIFDACADGDGSEVVYVEKSARIGYSLAVTAYGLWSLAERRRHTTFYLPNDSDAKDFGKTGLAPMLRDSPPLAEMTELVEDGRETRNAVTKVLGGKILRVLGAQTPDDSDASRPTSWCSTSLTTTPMSERAM